MSEDETKRLEQEMVERFAPRVWIKNSVDVRGGGGGGGGGKGGKGGGGGGGGAISVASGGGEAAVRPASAPGDGESVRVVVRCRPMFGKEIAEARQSIVACDEDAGAVEVAGWEGRPPARFTFDRVFGPTTAQADVYDAVGADLVQSVANGCARAGSRAAPVTPPRLPALTSFCRPVQRHDHCVWAKGEREEVYDGDAGGGYVWV